MHFVDEEGKHEDRPVELVLLAIPVEKLTELVKDDVYAFAPALGELRNVRTRAMTAFNIYFKRGIPGMPSAHVNLLDSRYGISFIDFSQTWGTRGTALNLIASDVSDPEGLSPLVAVSALMEDLRRYLPPFSLEDVERITFQSHAGQPLFMNDVGGWSFRPEARTQMKNLYLAGDFCRTHIDLVSMEAAVSSALDAAEAIRSDVAVGTPIRNLVV